MVSLKKLVIQAKSMKLASIPMTPDVEECFKTIIKNRKSPYKVQMPKVTPHLTPEAYRNMAKYAMLSEVGNFEKPSKIKENEENQGMIKVLFICHGTR